MSGYILNTCTWSLHNLDRNTVLRTESERLLSTGAIISPIASRPAARRRARARTPPDRLLTFIVGTTAYQATKTTGRNCCPTIPNAPFRLSPLPCDHQSQPWRREVEGVKPNNNQQQVHITGSRAWPRHNEFGGVQFTRPSNAIPVR